MEDEHIAEPATPKRMPEEAESSEPTEVAERMSLDGDAPGEGDSETEEEDPDKEATSNEQRENDVLGRFVASCSAAKAAAENEASIPEEDDAEMAEEDAEALEAETGALQTIAEEGGDAELRAGSGHRAGRAASRSQQAREVVGRQEDSSPGRRCPSPKGPPSAAGVTEWSLYLMRQVDRLSRRIENLERDTLPGLQRTALDALSLCRSQETRLKAWSENAADVINKLGEDMNTRRMEVQELQRAFAQSLGSHGSEDTSDQDCLTPKAREVDTTAFAAACQHLAAEAAERLELKAAEQMDLLSREMVAQREEISREIEEMASSLMDSWEELQGQRYGLGIAEEGHVPSMNRTSKKPSPVRCGYHFRTLSMENQTRHLSPVHTPRDTPRGCPSRGSTMSPRGCSLKTAATEGRSPLDYGLLGALEAVESDASLRRQVFEGVCEVRKELEDFTTPEKRRARADLAELTTPELRRLQKDLEDSSPEFCKVRKELVEAGSLEAAGYGRRPGPLLWHSGEEAAPAPECGRSWRFWPGCSSAAAEPVIAVADCQGCEEKAAAAEGKGLWDGLVRTSSVFVPPPVPEERPGRVDAL